MKSKIDRIAGRIAKRGLTRDASPLERRVAKALKIAAVRRMRKSGGRARKPESTSRLKRKPEQLQRASAAS